MQMAQARGATVWSTPWSPPASDKDSGTVDGGNFVASTSNYTTYAAQLAGYAAAMRSTYGVNIHAVSVQNEPDANETTYESCVWTGQQIHDFVPYLASALNTAGVPNTEIILPEEESWDFSMATTTMSDPTTAGAARQRRLNMARRSGRRSITLARMTPSRTGWRSRRRSTPS
jgi:glucuronoarabinoxylan endo-1,4-beta-xylanase